MAGFVAVPRPNVPTLQPVLPDYGLAAVTARDVDGTTVPRTLAARLGHFLDHTSGWVNVKTYGAGNGSRAQDMQAFRDALAALPNGGTVFMPEGTYYPFPGASDGSWGVYVGGRSNVTFRGTGRGTILKLPDSTPSGRHLFGTGYVDSVSNLVFRDFAVDLNAVNNLQTSWGSRFNAAFYFAGPLTNATFENLYIHDLSGSQAISIGNNTASTYGRNIKLLNNEFRNFGFAIPSNLQQDTSVVYIQADQILAQGNLFACDNFTFDLAKGHTALELHGDSDTKVIGNSFRYLQMPVLIEASYKTHSNVLVQGNHFYQTQYLVSLNGSGSTDNGGVAFDETRIRVVDNSYFSTKAQAAIVNVGAPGETQRSRSLEFSRNLLEAGGNPNQQVHVFRIEDRWINALAIEDNQINGFLGSLVYMAGTVKASGALDISIRNNRLDSLGATADVGGSGGPTLPSFVHIATSSNTINSVTIEGNRLTNTAGRNYATFGALRVNAAVSHVRIRNNTWTAAYPLTTGTITGATTNVVNPDAAVPILAWGIFRIDAAGAATIVAGSGFASGTWSGAVLSVVLAGTALSNFYVMALPVNAGAAIYPMAYNTTDLSHSQAVFSRTLVNGQDYIAVTAIGQ